MRVRRCNFFVQNYFDLLLFQVSDNKRRYTKKQCCKLYHARKRFPCHLIITTLLQGKSVRPSCAVQNSVTALRFIFYHIYPLTSIYFWNILSLYTIVYYRVDNKKGTARFVQCQDLCPLERIVCGSIAGR